MSTSVAKVPLLKKLEGLRRTSWLNYGCIERREVDLLDEQSFALLAKQCHTLRDFDWARLTFELDSYMDEVHTLVRAIYRT